MKMTLTISSIVCESTCSIPPKEDNVFLLVQADAGLPRRYPPLAVCDMGKGSSFTLPDGGYSIDFTYGVLVTAWDQDSILITELNAPDFLFNIAVDAGTPSGSTTTYNKNGASYTYTIAVTQ